MMGLARLVQESSDPRDRLAHGVITLSEAATRYAERASVGPRLEPDAGARNSNPAAHCLSERGYPWKAASDAARTLATDLAHGAFCCSPWEEAGQGRASR